MEVNLGAVVHVVAPVVGGEHLVASGIELPGRAARGLVAVVVAVVVDPVAVPAVLVDVVITGTALDAVAVGVPVRGSGERKAVAVVVDVVERVLVD